MKTTLRVGPVELDDAHRRAGKLYHEFLRAPSMSAGIYRLAAGAEDKQTPHAEDELYVVMKGRGAFVVGNERHAVEPGTILFVPGGAAHRFVDLTEPLEVVVVFAPPES